MDGIGVAHKFIEKKYSHCLVALLAGSVVRGEATKTSDLDIVIITTDDEAPYRESYRMFGWPIEVFAHTVDSYGDFFRSDIERRRPSLPKMCAEGLVLKDTNALAEKIKREANELLEKGVPPYSNIELEDKRYFITDLLDDLIGESHPPQELFIVSELMKDIGNFILVNKGDWEAKGKWIPKKIKNLDNGLYTRFMTSLHAFYQEGDKSQFIKFVEDELDKQGGRLFEGYYRGKKNQ